MSLTQEQAMSVLDFDAEAIDSAVFDELVNYLYNYPSTPQGKQAEQILNQFQESEKAWTRVYQILEQSQSSNAKYIALNILQKVIKSQWRVLPQEQAEGIKNSVVEKIIQLSSDFESIQRERILLSKLNGVLVQIVKQEWPDRWTTFIDEIVGASNSSESLCQNNMEIFQLLSEELFDFSKGEVVQVKAKHLKDALCKQFSPIFELCMTVLDLSETPSLITQTLETMLRFLSWIPIGYVFETELVPKLVTKFLKVPVSRNLTMQCLAEIAALPGDMSQDVTAEALQDIKNKQLSLFQLILEQLVQMLPPGTDIKSSWDSSSMDDQNFVRSLSLFFTSWLKEHSLVLEQNMDFHPMLHSALRYLVMMSTVSDKEIFKICLEYWGTLAASLYNETPFSANGAGGFGGGLMLGHQSSPRRDLYAPILTEVRLVLISNMAKPEEVLVVETDDGEVVREFQKDTDTIELYKSMRVTLVYLTHLDTEDTERLITSKLNRQMDGSEYSWHNLNTLCWAIGSISGAMQVDDEKRFLVSVIKNLLCLVEEKRGKKHKAIIASNIMYIVGQYPRFLKAHWKFLKTVVKKLFEFMHERHEGVQDMACDTFMKIAIKCKRLFVTTQMSEVEPYVYEIIQTMSMITLDLTPSQVHTFYEAVGQTISAEADEQKCSFLITKLMESANLRWSTIISQAANNIDVLRDHDTVVQLVNILKTNTAACRSIGHPFITQLSVIYFDMLHVYKTMSENVQQAISSPHVVMADLVRAMRLARREILKLIGCWVSRSRDPQQVVENFIPPLLDAVLSDYNTSIPEARDHEVLSCMATIVNRLQSAMAPYTIQIFAATFESTLGMITQDFEQHPEHRTSFYNLLHAIVAHCFAALVKLTPDQWKMVITAVAWGFKHPMRNVADTSLRIMKEILDRVQRIPEMTQDFYVNFYLEILQEILSVMTDSAHLAGINLQSVILAHLFYVVESGQVSRPLGDNPNNTEFVRDYVANLLQSAFPHLQDAQVRVIVQGFFSYNQDPQQFKEHVRDFLVQCKEVVGEDLSGLYLAERQDALQRAQQEKMAQYAAIPGMLNPHINSSNLDGNLNDDD